LRTAVVLFTRDLRVHDHPALHTACRDADRVVPLFVLDDGILASRYAAPNRVAGLLEALRDLRSALIERGGGLVVRRGDTLEEVRELCTEVEADALHLTRDWSAHAHRRQAALEQLGAELGVTVTAHPGTVAIVPGDVAPASSDHFRVFTPYWRRWRSEEHRAPVPAPETVPTPTTVATGRLPAREDLVAGDEAPDRLRCGERAARARLDAWLDGPIDGYDEGRDDLADDRTSKLSPHLHLGCLSVAEVIDRVATRTERGLETDPDHPGRETFLQELCWRDFNHQLLAAMPDLPRQDIRSQGDRWRGDEDAITAWKEGRTGYPVVDAGMRQLRHEGWMHNRARMVTASFLTKHLRVDWRVGAWHFMDHLVDGDLANNFGQWQWTAGTGTDSRPNRMFNPVTQGQRYDPTGRYVRRYVPELADVPDGDLQAPWEAADSLFSAGDYPAPIVDHREARARFLDDRGA
jgi:deoxyribodipyrimidine photo-lyase